MGIDAVTNSRRESYKTDPGTYQFIKWLFSRLMRILYRYEVSGAENIPASGPTILAVNHLHLLDPMVVAPIVSRQVVTLAAGKWRRNLLIRTVLRGAGSIFIRRGEVDREALRACLEVLHDNGVLAVAPEGTRTKTGGLQQGKAGIAYLALRTNAIIVPIAFWGVEKLHWWTRLKRPTCRVVVGKPFRLPVLNRKPTNDELQQLTDLIMIKVGMMLPPEYRGVYDERIQAAEAGQSDEIKVLVD